MQTGVRRLVFSNFLEAVASPLGSNVGSLFISAFIWRATGSLIAVGLYFMGSFVFLVFAFWVNGHLLRRWKISRTFWLGATCAGLIMPAIILFSSAGPLWFMVYGCIWGFCLGLYWSNRNYLELQETDDHVRQYYFGLLYSFGQLTSLVVPFFAGWFIALGPSSGLLSTTQAYWILFLLALVLMLWSAFVINGGNFTTSCPVPITRRTANAGLNERRLFGLAIGVIDGIGYFFALIILIYLGSEGVLGTIAAVIAAVTGILMYLYGRFFDGRYRYAALAVSSGVFLACTIVFAFGPEPLGAAILVLFAGLANSFFGLIASPILLELSDKEMGERKDERYSFIFDNELFLNLGRAGAVLLVIAFTLFDTHSALVWSVLCAGIIQTVMTVGIVLKRLERSTTAPSLYDLVQKDRHQVFLMVCPATLPFSFATHPWLVVNRKGILTWYGISWRSAATSGKHKPLFGHHICNNCAGYLHKDTHLPEEGISILPLFERWFWKGRVRGVVTGEEDSLAAHMADFIEESFIDYPYSDRYSITGPNSNTYPQWVLNHFPESLLQLPWNSVGERIRAQAQLNLDKDRKVI